MTSILDALEKWKEAWASQNLNEYFSSYDSSFNPRPKQPSLHAWKDYKKRVILNKTFINIQFEDVDVSISENGNKAIISLLQHFESNTYKGDDHKQIVMKVYPIRMENSF